MKVTTGRKDITPTSNGKGKPCPYCKRKMVSHRHEEALNNPGLISTVEHIIPQSMGGNNSDENTMYACQRCNNLRGHVPYEAFLMFSRVVLQAYPNAPTTMLRNALNQFLLHLVEVAMRNKKEVRRAASLALLRFADETRENRE